MSASEAGVAAYLDYLGSLRESGADYFLEGGQAVNFWAEYIDALSLEMLAKYAQSQRPVTSPKVL